MATYESALAWAQTNMPYTVSFILQLGKPRADRNVPTAAVRSVDNKTAARWEFAYNPDFFDTLTEAETVGVMSHEIYHILLNHLEELVTNLDSDPKPFPDQKKMIMAQECIVNDSVIADGHELPDIDLIIGYEQLGFDTSNYTTKEIYDRIPEDNETLQNMKGDSDDGEDDGESAGQGKGGSPCDFGNLSDEDIRDLADALKGLVDQMSDEDAQNMQPAKKIKDSERAYSNKAGTEFDGSREYAAKMDVGEGWVNFLRKIHPDFLQGYGLFGKQRTTWAVPRKKFAHMYPKMLLPNKITSGDQNKKNGGYKPHIVLALDFSGSIPPETANKLARLARSIPNSIEVDCCTFSTKFVPFDHTRDDNEVAGGGTDFSAVEAFVRSLNKPEYPKAVVVITDGYADFYNSYYAPTDSQLRDNWYWVATEGRYTQIIENLLSQVGQQESHVYVLKDLFE